MGVVRSLCAAEPLEGRVLLTVVPSGFAESKVVDKLFSPTGMEVAPDGRIFLLEQSGGVRVIKDGQLLSAPFVTVPTEFKNERGLVGITFDPDFNTNGHVYLYWTDPAPRPHNVVSRFTAAGDVAAPGSRLDLVKLPDLNTPYHVGGAMRFGPDGKLYVAVGDNATPENAQRLSNPLGKVLRFNKDGSIPTDNPFYSEATGQGKAIWAYGLRNPFSFDIQAGTGRMLINDVGQDTWEEINVGEAGANYGWPGSEGPTTDSRYKAPLYAYKHTGDERTGQSVVGAAFYNPPAGGWTASAKLFPSDYAGQFFFADLTGGYVKVLNPATGTVNETFATHLARPVDVDVSPDGSVYVLARGASGGREGRVLQYTRTGASVQPPAILTQPSDQMAAPDDPPPTFSVEASGSEPIGYQWQRNGQTIPGATAAHYTPPSVSEADSGAAYRVVVTNAAGTATSDPATLTWTNNRRPAAVLSEPADGARFRGGQEIRFAGAATDPEDGPLPPTAYTWRVDYHTGGVPRPVLSPFSGATGGSFTVPTQTPYTATDVFYRVHLAVTDSGGRTVEVTRDILPRTATVRLSSSIPGLTVTLDGQPVTAPGLFQGVAGIERSLGAPESQTINGITYDFVSWSDRGPATHTIPTPDADATYMAIYRPREGTEGPADLVAAVEGGPTGTVLGGSKGTAEVRVVNAGASRAAGRVAVALFASADTTLDDADAPLATVTKRVKLLPGDDKTVKLKFTFPSQLTGGPGNGQAQPQYLLARVEPDGSIEEGTAANNVTAPAAPVMVTPQFVELTAAFPPGAAPTGLTPRRLAEADVVITNTGSVSATGRVRVTVAASADAAFDAGDVPLTSRAFRVKLSPGGGSKTLRLKFRVPRDLGTASHLLVLADADNRLAEVDETNNTASAPEAFSPEPS